MKKEEKFIAYIFLFMLTVIGVIISFFINNIKLGIAFGVLALIFTILAIYYNKSTVSWDDINKKVDSIEEKIDRLGE